MRKTALLVLALLLASFAANAQDLRLNEIVAKNAVSYTNADGKSPDWIEIKNVSAKPVNLSEYAIATKATLSSPWALPDELLAPNALRLFESKKDIAVEQWETSVDFGESFRYFVPASQIAGWTSPDFDDSGWDEGPTPIGFGEKYIRTAVEKGTRAVLLRKKFVVGDVRDVVRAVLHVDCDDGFIAYVNGREVARYNMDRDSFDAFATTYTDGVIASGEIPPSFEIKNPQEVFRKGENTLSLQVHNCSATSSDLVATPILSVGYADSDESRKPVSSYVDLVSGFLPFSLDASEDVVYLLRDSKIIDSIAWKDLPVDVSIGRIDGNDEGQYYFSPATPNAQNGKSAFVAKTLSQPKVNRKGCVVENGKSFYVAVFSSDNKVTLRYTVNGSVPTETSPICPDSIKIAKTTNLRVRAFRNGYLPSETETETYIFLPREQTLPIASITAAHDDFFGYTTGIYVEGPNAEEKDPHYGANYWQDWEKQVHFEYFTPDDGLVLSQDVGVRIGGNWSRMQPQKTLKLYARDKYGKDKMNYPFFADKPVSGFHIIILRNSGNDFNNTQMRDGVVSELAKQMDIDRQAYQPAVVYINGKYYGIQNVREKMNASFVAENYGYDKDDIDVIKNGGEVADGSSSDYWKMRGFMEKADLSRDENYQQARKYIDIQNFIDYNILEMYVVNEDWPGNNIAYWHSRTKDSPWRYMLFDTDFGLGIWNLEDKVNKNMFEWCTMTGSSDYATADWATVILRQLLKNGNFKRDFLNSMADHLNTTLSPRSVTHVIDSVQGLIADEMEHHIERWGYNWQDKWTREMREFGQRREAIMRKQAEQFFSTGGSYTLSLSVAGKGRVRLNTLSVRNFPWTGKYFKNNTVSLTAIPEPGYQFVRWEGAVSSEEETISLTTAESTSLKAVFSYAGGAPKLLFTEAHYHPLLADETEWLELYNDGPATVDLSRCSLSIDRYSQTFPIPEGISIEPGGFVLFANDADAFKARFPEVSAPVAGNLSFTFPKDFATIRLKDPNGCELARMYYSDDYKYAQKADGHGYSFNLEYHANLSATLDENLWHSAAQNPAALYSPAPAAPVLPPVINEINYASGKLADAGDWIELYNPNPDASLSLQDWMVQDKGGNVAVVYEPCILPPQQYIVFADNPEKFRAVYPDVECHQLALSLNNYVDEVRLYDQDEHLVDKVSYSMFESQWTKAAFEMGRSLSLRDASADNSRGENWSASRSLGTPGRANDFVLAAAEQSAAIQLAAYPNPCKSFIAVEAAGAFSYRLLSPAGALVASGNAENLAQIPTESLAKGAYFLFVTQNGAARFMKILKE